MNTLCLSESRPSDITRHSSTEHISLARYSEHASHLFALIIGIDNYVNCRRLRGATADAREMNVYLQEALGVPKDHIRMLIDRQATRKAIIRAFHDVRNDLRIRNGDPILIFFAGHGTELLAPSSWHIEDMIQSLLSYDFEVKQTHPIPDRTIGVLIDDIARAKGDNITVIFDCCFAAGGTRYEKDGYMARTEDILPDILVDVNELDEDILESRIGEIADDFIVQGRGSHVLLAAAGANELAYEHRGRGLFTCALLRTLKDNMLHDLTYAEVIDRIDLDSPFNNQTPRCVGTNSQRIIFDARMRTGRQIDYPAKFNDMQLIVDAGLAHGISHGAELTLYKGGLNLGAIKVDHGAAIGSFETTFTITEKRLKGVSSAQLSRVGKLPVYIAQIGDLKSITRIIGHGKGSSDFQIVKEPGEAKLEVAMEHNQFTFVDLGRWRKGFEPTRLPHTATTKTLVSVLKAAAHYYWHLDHKNKSTKTNYKVDVNFYQLGTKYDEDGVSYKFPIMTKPRLCRTDLSDHSHLIDFVVNPDALYGISIENHTDKDLYLNAFLFNSSLSIVQYYAQPTDGNPEPPLKPKKTLTIGYGPSGTSPFEFWLADNQEVDVGYLKLFFATRAIDLTDIAQNSPFSSSKNLSQKKGGDAREGGLYRRANDVKDIWFTKEIPVVQRRQGVAATS